MHNTFKSLCKIALIFVVSSMLMQPGFANNVVSDSVITAKIKAKTATDKSLSSLNVSVETNHGIVKLDGTVESDTEASALIELAQSTQGVRDVDTESLTVKKSFSPLHDVYTTAKVKGRFLRQKLIVSGSKITPATIHVETNNGIVYLSGSVKSQRTLKEVITLTKSISGVKDVDSRLKVLR